MVRQLLSALLLAITFSTAALAEDIVLKTSESQRLSIPGDQPLPQPGQQLVIPVRSGMQIVFEDDAAANAQLEYDRYSLILRYPDDRSVVIEDVLRNFEVAPRLFLAAEEKELMTARVLAALENGDDLSEALEETAAGPSGGGGEVFGMVQVINWFIDRMDMTAQAQADTLPGNSGPVAINDAGTPTLQQLLAQMQIAREQQLQALAIGYTETALQLHDKIAQRVASGAASSLMALQSEAFKLQAQLDQAQASFALELAIDRHQDLFGERLEACVLPSLEYTHNNDMRAALSKLSVAQQPMGRRYWRQVRFATETLDLLASLDELAVKIEQVTKDNFDLGRANFSELSSAIQTRLQVQVRLVQHRYQLLEAQAWLLAAQDKLGATLLKHPGWQ